MRVSDFVRTLNLGDRGCRSITSDGYNATVSWHVDCVSRVRGDSGSWEYYTNEDIDDGVLVFGSVTYIELRNAGFVPNDMINAINVVGEGNGLATVNVSIDSVDGVWHITTKWFCGSYAPAYTLRIPRDPSRPGVRITT